MAPTRLWSLDWSEAWVRKIPRPTRTEIPLSFVSGQQQLPPGTQVRIVTSDGEGNQTPIGANGVDPSVTANPQAGNEGGDTPPPTSPPNQAQGTGEVQKEEKKEPPVAKRAVAPKSTPKQQPRPPSKDAVLSRARRLQRKDRKQIWEQMGWGSDEEPYSDEAFETKMASIQAEREKGMSESERLQNRMQSFEQEKQSWQQEKLQLQQKLTEATQQIQTMERAQRNAEIESTVKQQALAAGFKEEALDYALYRLKKHAVELPEGQEPDPVSFFTDMKGDPSNRAFFKEEAVPAGPQSIQQQQQQVPGQQQQVPGQQQQQQAQPQGTPQSQQINTQGVPPKPAPSNQGSGQVPNALEMSDQDYRKYVAEKYQYAPGRG